MQKRINTEINQLVNDIQRIEPQGESWCTFGKLFTDTAVEQYYEALVNTLKSAKRRGIVAFKGQFLLKGMHDHVIVSVVTNNDSKKKDVNVAAKERTRETINNKTQKKHQHFHYREFSSTEEKQLDDNHSKQETEDDGHYQHPRRSHDLNQNAFPVSPIYSQHSLHSIQQQQQQHDSSSATVQADLDHSIKDTDILVRESSQPTMMKMISPLESSNHDLNDDVCHQRQSQQYTGESYNHYHHQSTTLKSSPSSYPVSNLETKLEKLLHSSSSSSPTTSTKQKQSSCNSPVTSFASAPVCSSTSSNHTNNVNSDVSHMQSSGTTSHSSSYNAPESHQNRVEREIHQLIKDIKRIEPSDKSFCLFGVLFDDPDVEQYYEALVGTLKAARKKGAITFQGQMLLKGMHDNVQISVVE